MSLLVSLLFTDNAAHWKGVAFDFKFDVNKSWKDVQRSLQIKLQLLDRQTIKN